MNGRYQRYKKAELPSRFWDLKPLVYVREEGLEDKFEGLVEACKGYAQDVTYGIVVESRDENIRPVFAAALLKYLTALNNKQGYWRTFIRLASFIRSTKFNQEGWEEFVDMVTRPPHQILVIEGMSAKSMVNMDEDERLRLFDFFQSLFYNSCLVIVSTPENQDRFEKSLGVDLSNLLSDNLGTWGKL